MHLTSSAFPDGDDIPKTYSAYGENINPPLEWSDAPTGTQSFALTVEDPDIPSSLGIPVLDHWVVWNIPQTMTNIPENWQIIGTRGKGTRGLLTYTGPRPPDRIHRYFFHLYALDEMLTLPEGSTKAELLSAMNDHVLGDAVLMGRFAPMQQ